MSSCQTVVSSLAHSHYLTPDSTLPVSLLLGCSPPRATLSHPASVGSSNSKSRQLHCDTSLAVFEGKLLVNQ